MMLVSMLVVMATFEKLPLDSPLLALGMPGVPEMLLIALVILLLFGARRLPELARGLGKGIREFRGAVSETSDELKKAVDEPEKPSTPPKPGVDETKPDNSRPSDT